MPGPARRRRRARRPSDASAVRPRAAPLRSPSPRAGEVVFAFLDDIYVVAEPERVRPLLDALSAALWEHARVRLHAGKTRIWNAAGEELP